MKTFLTVLISLAVVSSAMSQVRFGIKSGVAPTREMGTAPIIVNRHDPSSEFLFNGREMQFTPALGLTARIQKSQYFFSADALYYGMRKTYAMHYTDGSPADQPAQIMQESCRTIEIPVTAGVTLGRFEVMSGFSARYEFDRNSNLSAMKGYTGNPQEITYGWHGGAGIHFGRISAEIRYLQDFANLGQGIHVNGNELLLRNAPSQVRFMVSLWF